MDSKPQSILAIAVAATLAPAAEAATTAVTLVKYESFSNGGITLGDTGSSTATFAYDDASGLLTQTGGTFNVRLSIVPNVVTLFRHLITGIVLGNGGAATATTYVCANGNFGAITGASLCGNYNFGANFVDESTISYGPGTSFNRTLGGDDMSVGPVQNISEYDGFTTTSWNGHQLVIENSYCSFGTSCGPGGPSAGYRWTLQSITLEPDVDGDGVPDQVDKCTLISNASQCDSDADGYGNHCDGDMNNNTITNAQDYVLFRAQMFQPSVAPTYNQADINCNGTVNAQDYVLFRGLLGKPSGPSGLAP